MSLMTEPMLWDRLFGELAYAIDKTLSDNGAARVDANYTRLPYMATIEGRIFVSDMVPSLQKFTVTTEEWLVTRDARTLAEPIGNVRAIVEAEREVRRWSQVDP